MGVGIYTKHKAIKCGKQKILRKINKEETKLIKSKMMNDGGQSEDQVVGKRMKRDSVDS